MNQLVGALILKHLYNWTYQDLFTNLNFNILTRHALGINSLNEDVFCEASIFNFQNKLIDHQNNCGEDLMEKVFCNLTANQIKDLGIDTSVQRGDSFLVGSNIIDYSRLHLLIEVAVRLSKVLEDSDKELLADKLSTYIKFSASQYIYHVKRENLPSEFEKLGELYGYILSTLGNRYLLVKQYLNFKRVFEEHFKLDQGEKIAVKSSKELHSSILMSPDDEEATYRGKNGHSSKGYVTHISETVNPSNKVNLITDVVTQKNNIGDAEILENRLPIMIDQTPDIKEYFIDGLYGSPNVDQIAESADIILYTRTARGRRSKAEIKIKQDESLNVWVSCKGGQTIQAIQTGRKNYKGEFDPSICSQCPYENECKEKKTQSKTKVQKRVIYFEPCKISTHKRLSNIEKLEGNKRYSRANVEASVKEMKRGMKNGKVRIRGWSRLSQHMILTAIAINFTRIHKNIAIKMILWVISLLKVRQFVRIPNLLRYVKSKWIIYNNLQKTCF